MQRALASLSMGMILVAGCQVPDVKTATVPPNHFGSPDGGTVLPVPSDPATQETAARVDTVGRQLLAANPQLGLRVNFRTIGAPQPEVFHVGASEIDITEGLVKQCVTNGQLAAVLSTELGKMVTEREILAGSQTRNPDVLPPINVPVGNNNAGLDFAPDQTYRAEMGMFERANRRPNQQPAPPPDPQALARTYLTKAGYAERELDDANALLQAAATNGTFARQMKSSAQNQVAQPQPQTAISVQPQTGFPTQPQTAFPTQPAQQPAQRTWATP